MIRSLDQKKKNGISDKKKNGLPQNGRFLEYQKFSLFIQFLNLWQTKPCNDACTENNRQEDKSLKADFFFGENDSLRDPLQETILK